MVSKDLIQAILPRIKKLPQVKIYISTRDEKL
jgi:hypothetical protein